MMEKRSINEETGFTKQKRKTCYICRKAATSKEHVPPQCLFPEEKDTEGADFRKGLITVPSCDEHNSKKSKDDEFLMISIAGIVTNNFLGFFHTHTKVKRALRWKKETYFAREVLRNATPHQIESQSGKKFPVLVGNPDFERLEKCFEHIARGLYYHQFRTAFKGECRMILGFITYSDENSNTLAKFIKRRFELEDLAQDVKGSNPEIFKYQFCAPDQHGLIGLVMTFYQGTEVFVGFQPEGTAPPFHLGMHMMERGMPITFTLGDDMYEFNSKQNNTHTNKSGSHKQSTNTTARKPENGHPD